MSQQDHELGDDVALEATESAEAPEERRRPISRHEVVRRIINLYDDPRYLEVGVCEGVTFHRVPAPYKVAVDPEFRFDHEQAAADRPGHHYHQITSDAYFADVVARDETFHVIYLDGLHTFEQTLRDLMNALQHLAPDGVIVVDDTHPPTYLAAVRDRSNYFEVRRWLEDDHDLRWMGDVFRLVWFVEAFCPFLEYRTISNNHGQTVLWRTNTPRTPHDPERLVADVAALDFEHMVLHEDVLKLARYGEIRRLLRRDLGL